MISVQEARQIILDAAQPLLPDRVPLQKCISRVLAEDVHADVDIPPFTNSAMDGFAVRAADIAGATAEEPTVLTVIADLAAGTVAKQPVEPGTAYRIMTGAPMPNGADTVVMQEMTESFGDQVRIMAPRPAGANVREAGGDMRRGQRVLDKGTRLRPAELGVLATVGQSFPLVYPVPRVAVLATGSELVEVDQQLGPGQIRNSNGYTLYGQVWETGAVPVSLGTVADDEAETEAKISAALKCDVVVTSGGVSVGAYDFVKETHEKLGTEFRFWKINVKPGKPTAFGLNGKTLVFGLPGNPVASMVIFEQLVRPALLKMMGRTQLDRPTVDAIADEPFTAKDGKTHFVRAIVTRVNGDYHVRSTGGQGSHMISSMAKGNAFVVLTPERQSVAEGERATAQLFDLPEWAP